MEGSLYITVNGKETHLGDYTYDESAVIKDRIIAALKEVSADYGCLYPTFRLEFYF